MRTRRQGFSNGLCAPCQQLSGALTPVFNLGFPGVIVTILIISTFADVQRRPPQSLLGLTLAWILLLGLAFWLMRLKKVVACGGHLRISNYITATCVPYDDIEEIRVPRRRRPVFVRLRLRNACRFGRTIRFLLPSTPYMVELQPEIELLRGKCPHLCEQSGVWWFARMCLRPRAIQTRSGTHQGAEDDVLSATGQRRPAN
jgi:hypothetical protein